MGVPPWLWRYPHIGCTPPIPSLLHLLEDGRDPRHGPTLGTGIQQGVVGDGVARDACSPRGQKFLSDPFVVAHGLLSHPFTTISMKMGF